MHTWAPSYNDAKPVSKPIVQSMLMPIIVAKIIPFEGSNTIPQADRDIVSNGYGGKLNPSIKNKCVYGIWNYRGSIFTMAFKLNCGNDLEQGTDHRIVSVNIQFNSFIFGIGYYRCPPDLLSDEIFKGVLRTTVCSIIAKHTNGPLIEDTKLQLNENLKPPIEIVEEILEETGTITANYPQEEEDGG